MTATPELCPGGTRTSTSGVTGVLNGCVLVRLPRRRRRGTAAVGGVSSAWTLPFIRARWQRDLNLGGRAWEVPSAAAVCYRTGGMSCEVATAEPSQGISARSREAWWPFSWSRALVTPRPAVLAAIGAAGLAVAGLTVALGLTSDALDHVPIRIFLNDWLIVNYIVAGLIAWWRRPDSRFGPLMVAAGFVNFLGGAFDWANADVLVTIGLVLDLLPPMFFLYVFLAYPSGRLASRVDQLVVLGAFVTAVGLDLARMTLGGLGPRNLLEIVSEPGAAKVVTDVQLSALSGFCLAGIVLLALRRWGPRRAPRRPLGLLVDSFALGLVMIAVLFLSFVIVGAHVLWVDYATFFVVGLAPIVFLVALLQSPARRWAGDRVAQLGGRTRQRG
jgi:hypothetical protein